MTQITKSKKGFTLVEVIVVLVILAILMAIAVPALTGYIDKAKFTQVKADARTVQVALQAIVSENYATTGGDPVYGTLTITSLVRTGPYVPNFENTGKTYLATINELTGRNFKATQFFDTPASKRPTFTPRYSSGTLMSFNFRSEDGKIEVRYEKDKGFFLVE